MVQVDKTHYVRKVKQIPTEEGRNAELAVYRRKPEEAEAILLQAGLVYRAIKMNIKLFNFERALDLATQYKQHQDTVLHYRQQFLKTAKQTETITRFIQMNESVGAGRGAAEYDDDIVSCPRSLCPLAARNNWRERAAACMLFAVTVRVN